MRTIQPKHAEKQRPKSEFRPEKTHGKAEKAMDCSLWEKYHLRSVDGSFTPISLLSHTDHHSGRTETPSSSALWENVKNVAIVCNIPSKNA
jgi:hypothetical protein